MVDDRYSKLFKELPSIANVVNLFSSGEAQVLVCQLLLQEFLSNGLAVRPDRHIVTPSRGNDAPEVLPQKRKPRTEKVASANRNPSILGNLNLRPTKGPSLAEFVKSKGPLNHQERVTVIVYYLARMLRISQVNRDHVYTCYKSVGARVPTNLDQLLWNTSARKGWINTSNSDNILLNVQGENFVEHDLPRSTAKAAKPTLIQQRQEN